MFSLIYLMAGKGQRMELGFNKVFYEYDTNKFIFQKALNQFLKFNTINEIFLVTNAENHSFITKLYDDNPLIKVVLGGEKRLDSVYSALDLIKNEYVIIHDAARAFISWRDISQMLGTKTDYDAIYACKKETNTIRKQINEKFETLNRTHLFLVETPQFFKTDVLKSCFSNKKEHTDYTDEISLLEEGEYKVFPHITIDLNRKLTNKDDLDYFLFLEKREKNK